MRRLLQPDRVGIGKDVRAIHGDNPSSFAAAIARQSRVRKWMQRMRQHPNGNLPSQSACIYRPLELLIHTQDWGIDEG
jgi:hypothetical protein